MDRALITMCSRTRTARFVRFFRAIAAATANAGATSCARSRIIDEVPADLISNLMVIRGSINGSQPLFFVVDTGAGSSVIDRTRAEELGLHY
jgi:Aspartyl protease